MGSRFHLQWMNCYRNDGLAIQDIQVNGRIYKDGRLRVHDRIIAINGTSLIGLSFEK